MKKLRHRTIAGLLALLLCAATLAWAEETEPEDPAAAEDGYTAESQDSFSSDETEFLPEQSADMKSGTTEPAADEEQNTTVESMEFSALSKMGLLPEALMNMGKNQLVSRALLSGAMVQLAGFSAGESGAAIPFTDVTADTPHRDAIAYLYHAGILRGNGDNTFSPDAGITYTEAFKALIDLLGYRDYTKARFGEYPGSYLAMARQLDLTDGLSTDRFDTVLTASDAAVLLYNCAITCLPSPISYSADGTVTYTIDESKYLLSVYQNIFHGKGILNDDGLVSLTGSDSASDTVRIDGIAYRNSSVAADTLLGCRVQFFYRSVNGTDTLLWAEADQDNRILEIKSKDLMTEDAAYGYRNIVYWKGGQRRSVRIGDWADVVYNHNLVNNYTLAQISPKMGSLRMIDNDADGTYDVVLVTEYRNMWVNAVPTNGGYISGQYGDTLQLDDFETVKIWNGNTLVTEDSISEGRVISYVKSPDGKILFIYINGPGTVNTLELVRDKGEETEYTFSGKAFTMAYSLKQLIETKRYNIPAMVVGGQYRYYLDMEDCIAALEETGGTLQYAYFIDGKIDQSPFSKSGSAQLRMTLQNGLVTTLKTANKVKINGEENKKGTDILDRVISAQTGKVEEQIVKVALNDSGEVCEIEFAVNSADAGKDYDPTQFSCDYSKSGALYNTDNCFVFDSKYFVNGSTVGFVKYTNPDGSVDYGTIVFGNLSNQSKYDIKLYDCDSCLTAGAMSVTKTGSGYLEGYILVDNVTKTLDRDGLGCVEVEGIYAGNAVKYTADDDGTVPDTLKRGDVVQISLSMLTNKIEKVNPVCSLSEHPRPLIGGAPGSRLVPIFGYLYTYNGRVLVTVNPDGSPYGRFTATATTNGAVGVAIYDAKSDTVSTGTLEDIYPLQAPDGTGNPTISDDSVMVFVQRRYNYTRSIVVVYY